jgi:hypothetical protein
LPGNVNASRAILPEAVAEKWSVKIAGLFVALLASLVAAVDVV